ncbi:MAG: hypothetical protein M3O70_25130 [Actinomycetota bacterium]|nr:hypothetical protein [Actinomycetota bacterium]
MVCEDAQGDVRDADGNPLPYVHPGTDLTEVEVRSDRGNSLLVIWWVDSQLPSGAEPESGGSITWYVDSTRRDGSPLYALAVDLIDDKWFMGIDYWTGAEDGSTRKNYKADPLVGGDYLIGRFMMSDLPEWEPGVQWRAGVEWGQAGDYADYCPQGGPDEWLTFSDHP